MNNTLSIRSYTSLRSFVRNCLVPFWIVAFHCMSLLQKYCSDRESLIDRTDNAVRLGEQTTEWRTPSSLDVDTIARPISFFFSTFFLFLSYGDRTRYGP